MIFIDVKQIDNFIINDVSKVRVKEMGNITEIMYSNSYSSKCSIKKISGKEYIDMETGELKKFVKMENRAFNIASVKKSLGRLRDYINTNVVDVDCCKWVTLTYAANMRDTKKLKDDFKNFNTRLRKEVGPYEYIVAREPQGRGAWHMHVLLIFSKPVGFIDNRVIWKAWSPKGFKNNYDYTKITNIDNVDNVGAYLTAYMTDMRLDDVIDNKVENVSFDNLKKIDDKKYIKGARLVLYPPQFNIYSCSRGIKKPIIYYDIQKNVKNRVSSAKLTFEKSIELVDNEANFNKILNYKYYNSKRLITSYYI